MVRELFSVSRVSLTYLFSHQYFLTCRFLFSVIDSLEDYDPSCMPKVFIAPLERYYADRSLVVVRPPLTGGCKL